MSGMLTSVRVRMPRAQTQRRMPSLRTHLKRSREQAALREYRRIVRADRATREAATPFYRTVPDRLF